MSEANLENRLEILKGKLEGTLEGPQRLKDRLDKLTLRPELWEAIDEALSGAIRPLLIRVGNAREMLATARGQDEESARATVREAWDEYTKMLEDSREVVEECMALLGGLSMRDEGLDEEFLEVADELIQACSRTSIARPWQSVTIPAPHETLSKTIARVIRMPFPEWSIWTLPFTAREYGYVLIKEKEPLRDLVDEQAQLLVAKEFHVRARPPGLAEEAAQEHARNQVRAHVADASATYMIGPAYACAATMLRFNPARAFVETDSTPADAKRTHLIFNILERMNQKAKAASSAAPYSRVLGRLRTEWERMLQQASPSESLDGDEKSYLDELADRIWKVLEGGTLRSSAAYTPRGTYQGWNKATEWHEEWSRQLRERKELKVSAGETNTLRDVLNAAWLCRIENEATFARDIDRAARATCEQIIAASSTAAVQRGETRFRAGKVTQPASPRPS